MNAQHTPGLEAVNHKDHVCVICGHVGWLRCAFVTHEAGLVCNECAGTLTERTLPLPSSHARANILSARETSAPRNRRCDTCDWCTETAALEALCSRPSTIANGWNWRSSTCEEHVFESPRGGPA